jgi:hypothetical protein
MTTTLYTTEQTTVRIREEARRVLRDLSRAEGRPMSTILEDAIEVYRRQRFLEGVNAGYAALRRDARGWAALTEELDGLDATLGDGLLAAEDAPPYGSPPKSNRKPRKAPRARKRS